MRCISHRPWQKLGFLWTVSMEQVDLTLLKLLEFCDLQVFFFFLTCKTMQFMLRLLAAINFVVISKQQALNEKKKKRNSMMVQLLGLHASTKEAWVRCLVRELVLQTQEKTKNKNNRPWISPVLILPTSSSLFEPFHFHHSLCRENIALR